MILGTSAQGPEAAVALARKHGTSCELFVQPDSGEHVAVLAIGRAEDSAWSFTPVQPLFAGGRVGDAGGPWLFRVGLWTPHEQREEFLAWYEQEHLPMLLECASWDGCRFIEAPDAEGCQFFALHQLADRAALDSAERARSRSTPWFRKLKHYDWFDEPFTRTLYRRVHVR